MRLTHNQKKAIKVLMEGGSLVNLGDNIRVRDAGVNPVVKLTTRSFYKLRYKLDILKKSRKLGFVFKPSGVRTLHKNSWVRKTWQTLKTSQNGTN